MEVLTIPLSGEQDSGKYIIYRPLAGLAFVGNRAMAELAVRTTSSAWSLSHETPASQKAAEFLRQIGFFEPDPPPPPAQQYGYYQSVVLLLTNQCQLRCTYCYAEAGVRPLAQLSEADGRTALDYLFEQAAVNGLSSVAVSFHGGGEPTFAWPLLQNLTQYARSKPLPVRISIMSNGMWSPDQRDWILNNIDQIGISMDGMPETQNRQRPLVSGKDSAPVVMGNLAEMDRRGVGYGIRMTVTAPWTSLPADIEFLCKETHCQAIQAEPAFNTERGKFLSPPELERHWQQFAGAFVQAAEIARSHKRQLSYSGARAGTVAEVFCTAPFDALVVAPGGKIVSCYEVTSDIHPLAPLSHFGKIETGKVKVDEAARQQLFQLMAERRSTCRDCFCYWSCAGDCYAQAFLPEPQGHLVHGARCRMNQKITEEMLLGLIAESNGVWNSHTFAAASMSAEEEERYG